MNLNPPQSPVSDPLPDPRLSGSAGAGDPAPAVAVAVAAGAGAGDAVPDAAAPLFAEVDFVDHVFTYLLREFPHLAGPQFSKAKRAVREHLGGDRVYIARRASEGLAHQVLSLFNGRNASEVARSLNISRATVYRLLKQAPRRDGSA